MKISLRMTPEFRLTVGEKEYNYLPGFRCYVERIGGGKAYFDQAKCEVRPHITGVGHGYALTYSGFEGIEGLALHAFIWVEDATQDVYFQIVAAQDAPLRQIVWPAPFAHEGEDGMTVLPLMQGSLIPNFWPKPIIHKNEEHEHALTRGMYMPFYGQYDGRGGYAAILDTPYDGGYLLDCPGGAPVHVGPRWYASMGELREPRTLLVRFLPAGSDYNEVCKAYRTRVKENGKLVTLLQKAADNPKLMDLIGRPIVHTHIWYHVEPTSSYYNKEKPEENERMQTFEQVAEGLRRLKEMGVEAAALHLDGWGRRGYDNLHPDCLPPCEAAGGWAGMKALADACHELGYFFGTHDQYRDYFFDADSFDVENAVHAPDGSVEEHCIWYGGRQTYLCATLAPHYVRRNFHELARHEVELDNTYLDVFSVVKLEECYHADHPMTRAQCAGARLRCFSEVASRGILVSSEEVVDWALPGISFCHHAPYMLEGEDWSSGDALGIPLPLFNLVYHDCVIMPWFPQVGGWGVPEKDDGALNSLLMGNATYISLDADEAQIARSKELLAWQREVQLREMTRHEFVGGNLRHQKCTFEGGYAAEVNYDTGEYALTRP